MKQNYTMDKNRNPTKWEIEGAKLLRGITLSEQENKRYSNLSSFLKDTYFEIQDYGITDETSNKIRNQLLKYKRIIPNAQNIAEHIFAPPLPQEEKKPIKKQTYLDIAIQVIRYHKNNELRGKKKLDASDVLEVLVLVAEYYSVPYEKCISRIRKKEFVLVRAMTALLCAHKTSTIVIGRAINRDHSTVIHHISKLQETLRENPKEMDNYHKLIGITGL